MRVDTFFGFANTYAQMGWAVQEQLNDVLDEEPLEDQNINALVMIHSLLSDIASEDVEFAEGIEELLEQLTDYLEDAGRL